MQDLRQFVSRLERQGDLKRVLVPVDPNLEVTEISYRCLRAQGPALLFERPKGASTPMLTNLFGTPQRVALALGRESPQELRELGEQLAFLKEPQMPRDMRDAVQKFSAFRPLLHVSPRVVRRSRPAGTRTPAGSSPSASSSLRARTRSGRTSASTANR